MSEEALHILLTTHNPPADYSTYLHLLQTCILKNALSQAKKVHSFIAHRRFPFATLTTFHNKLVYMYVKCRSLENARKVFDHIKKRDTVSWNTIIAAYGRHGCPHEAVTLFHQMQETGLQPDQFTFASVLPACAKIGALEQGMAIHKSLEDRGILSDVVVASALVDMYAKCGSIDRARELFDRMPHRNVISWTAMIAGYVQNGFVEKGIETFKQMQLAGVKPNSTTFVSILPACAKMGILDQGMDIHQSINDRGILSDVAVGTALVDMYAKCGSIVKAREVFEKMPQRNVVSWTAMIAGYAQRGFLEEALETFKQMQMAGVQPNSTTFSIILPVCAKLGALEQGINIHQSIKERGIFSDVVATALLDMYAKCGSTDKASELFDKMLQRTVVSWNAMIAGYSQNGLAEKASETFEQMQSAGVKPNSTTFASILPAYAKMGALEQGMNIHQSIMEGGFSIDIIVGNALVDMYAKCGSIDKARHLFHRMPQKDVISWNTMIAGYTQNGFVEKALETFKQMQLVDVKPNFTTFASILPACAKMGALEQGINIHQTIVEGGFSSDIIVGNALVNMYAKCGSIYKAHELFERMPQRDVVSWNAMIAGYAQTGFVEKAFQTFKKMQLAGVKPDSTTFANILPACAKIRALKQCMYIHQSVVEGGFSLDLIVGNALVDMYAKYGYMDKAHKLFDRMPQRDAISWTVMIAGYAQNGFVEIALETFKQMQLAGVKPDSTTFASILTICTKMGALEQGMDIHKSIIEEGFFSDIIVGNALVDMYAKCRSIDKAHEMFDRLPQRDVISWNAMIAGYAINGFDKRALETFKQMQLAGVKPDSTTFACILPACAKMGALEPGMDIHQSIMEGGFLSDIIVGNALVDMYAKCGNMERALTLFERMPQRNVISWNSMIAGYAQNGFVENALETFKQMQLAGLKPDSTTYACIVHACAKIGAFEQGISIHQSIMEGGFLPDIVVGNALVDMYAKCGSIDKACELFNRMLQRNAISWNAMIAGYAQNGLVEKALETLKQMQLAGLKPNCTTFASILPACAKMGALEQGISIHQSIMEGGFLSDIMVGNALIDMYAKCGSMNKALELFKRMLQRNVISWNAIIAGYVQNGFVENALEIFKQMQLAGVRPDSTTFACILPACAKMGALEQGVSIHQSTMEGGFLSNIIVGNALVDMYAKCGSIDKARELFDRMHQRDVVSWNAMIAGYAQNGFVENALETFKQMQLAVVKPNSTTFASILPACAKMGAFEQGMDIHQSILDGGFLSDIIVGNALVDMYAKCGRTDKAHELFDSMPQRDVISWNTMIAGYAQNGFVEKALETLKQMQFVGLNPDSTTFASILPACAKMGAIKQGLNIHQSIMVGGFLSDIIVGNALIDMYAKCGSIDKAHKLFDKMPQRDVVTWNAVISGYAQNGFCKDALKIFELMKHSGTYPNIVSFACVLCACSHAGLVDEGCAYFNHMSNPYCITPTVDHYVCMVDLLGRAGYLEETLRFIIKMPVKSVVIVWMCFLGACRSHMNIGLGMFTATLLFDLDPKNAATYVLLSNIYAEMGRWGEVQMVRRLMKDRGIKKIPGCSWIESHKVVHAFCVGERSHP
ncbi:pentatricopeptide repeat-containing protein At3g09040, mitochondrial-like [Cryptomeria japonica]|uniref:pentatricopeptide repeat-containing protein At3g09040, mitochondrial-like n=1 Tax=Cryptomeria japonica TaxID=3369 RepID=UPI0025AD3818|nr:pentatricopeptide repeat-containing protein At3g09040, mitochondrial-like [Cryptomeria japonica]